MTDPKQQLLALLNDPEVQQKIRAAITTGAEISVAEQEAQLIRRLGSACADVLHAALGAQRAETLAERLLTACSERAARSAPRIP